MKILFIIENDESSANYIISKKLADYVATKQEVFIGYFDQGKECGKKDELLYENEFIFSDCRIQKVFEERRKLNWKEMGKKQKLHFFLTNPCLIRPYISFRVFKNDFCGTAAELDRYCKEKQIDVVIGVVFPYEIAILIGNMQASIKKCVVQFDPYSSNQVLEEPSFRTRVKTEKRILDKIDTLFTTDLIKHDIARIFGGKYIKKIVEIEFPGFSLNDKNENCMSAERRSQKDNSVTFLHAGSFYEKIRNPKYLVDIFEKLPSNYKLLVAGKNSSMIRQFDENIRSRVIDLGTLSQEELSKITDEVDFLICYNNLMTNQVPSKLFECIGSGKPFLNVIQLNECPSLKYVRDYENACIVNVENIDADEIEKFVANRRGVVTKKIDMIDKYPKHTTEYVGNLILENICDD